MKIWKPDYYDEFQCSASDCRYTCCQEWSIAVDSETGEKWKTMQVPEAVAKANPSLQGKCLISCASADAETEGQGVIRLNKDGKCPLLSEEKLCHVVRNYGEQAISWTCHTFPRKCQRYEDRLEYALDMGCPTALEQLWNSAAFAMECCEGQEKVLSDSMKELAENTDIPEDSTDSLLFLVREKAIRLVGREDIAPSDAWIMLFGIALDLYEHEKELSEDYIGMMFSEKVISQLKETLALSIAGRDPYDYFTEQNELFLDLAENYRQKNLYHEILGPLADRAEWFELTEDTYTLSMREEFEGIWKQQERGIRKLLQEELYSSLLYPGGNFYTVMLKLEWMGMLLAVMKQGLFLEWELKDEINEERILLIITVLMRMTGYNEDDIEEYLENSFENVIWDWGYMALIV